MASSTPSYGCKVTPAFARWADTLASSLPLSMNNVAAVGVSSAYAIVTGLHSTSAPRMLNSCRGDARAGD